MMDLNYLFHIDDEKRHKNIEHIFMFPINSAEELTHLPPGI